MWLQLRILDFFVLVSAMWLQLRILDFFVLVSAMWLRLRILDCFLVLFTARILQLRVSGNINSIYIKNHFVTVRRRFSIVTTNKSCPFHNQVRGTKLSERQNFKRQNSQRAEQTAIGYLYIAAKQRDDYSPGLYAISSIFATAFVSSGVTVGEDSPLSTFFKFSII